MSTLRTPVGDTDHVQGPPDARVTLLESGDYECPYCGAAYPIVKQIQHRFADRLLFAFRNFPLTNAHPNAMDAATRPSSPGEHGRFWEMHDGLYEHSSTLARRCTPPCRTDGPGRGRTASRDRRRPLHSHIRAQFTGGVRSGVNGTPTFFINGTRFDGPDFEAMANTIGEAIASPQ